MTKKRRIHKGIDRILPPGQHLEITFVPGDTTNISCGTINDGDAVILLEILAPGEPAAPPHRRAFGSEPVLQVNYQPKKKEEIASKQPWTVRVTSRSANHTRVVLDVDYPSDENLTTKVLPLGKLQAMTASALKEINPAIEVDGGVLRIHLDKSISEGKEHKLTRDLSDLPVEIRGFVSERVELAFLPKNDDFIGGAIQIKLVCKRDVSLKALGFRFVLPKPTFTLRVGLSVYGGGVHLRPVSFELPPVNADNWRTSALNAVWSVRDFAMKKLGQMLETFNLEFEGSGKPADIARRIEAAFDMSRLEHMQITEQGLELHYVEAASTTAPLPTITAPGKGRSPNLEHLVIVMMENRSFDHMMAELVAGRTDVDGPPAHYEEVYEGQVYSRRVTSMHAMPHDPPHGGGAHDTQARGEFVKAFKLSHPKSPFAGEVLNYQPRAHVPFFDFLTQNFCICDNWRSALPGHTWPNRLYSLSGSSGDTLDNPEMSRFRFYTLLTICDVLEAQGVPWAYFKEDFAFLELYRRWVFDQTRVKSRALFNQAIDAAIQGAKFPTVTWVEPNISDFGRSLGSDDHPPMSVLRGQAFLADVYNQLCRLPTKNWLLAITYDEVGGFYDHVGPEPAPDDGTKTKRRGFRVPAFLASPWLKPGSVCSTPFDHASLVRTVLDQFCNDEPLFTRDNTRVKHAKSFATVLDAGSPIAVAQARVVPKFTTPIPTLGLGMLDGLELAGDVDLAPRHPLFEAFLNAKQELIDEGKSPPLGLGAAVEGAPPPTLPGKPEKLATPPPTEEVRFEGIYIEATQPPNELVAAGWSYEPVFDDAIQASPPTQIDVSAAWDLVHDLRARHPAQVIDPLWETAFRANHPTEETAPVGHELASGTTPAPSAQPASTWHLERLRAVEAWTLTPPVAQQGDGIVVGHLDTGYRDHASLDEMWREEFGWDVFDDDSDPTDPLQSGLLLFPGHGTSTGGVIGSRGYARASEPTKILGTAPKARLIPFRISTSVIHVSMKRMVKGIERAIAAGAHVISISAGGLWSGALRRAVRDANTAGVIVVAAAGNYTEMVVWPARFDEYVISCGAIEPDGSRWPHSNGDDGPLVDVLAPGAQVWVLRPDKQTTTVALGSGTSFATACVAGAIATWLGFHGRDRLIARYGRANLARVIKQLIRKLTRKPGNKAGELDMLALLKEPLPDPGMQEIMMPTAPPPMDPLDMLGLAGELGTAPTPAQASYADEVAFRAAVTKLSSASASTAPVVDSALGLEMAGGVTKVAPTAIPMSARLAAATEK